MCPLSLPLFVQKILNSVSEDGFSTMAQTVPHFSRDPALTFLARMKHTKVH